MCEVVVRVMRGCKCFCLSKAAIVAARLTGAGSCSELTVQQDGFLWSRREQDRMAQHKSDYNLGVEI